MAEVTGIVLAAGSGRRAGGPKALRTTADGEPWLTRACLLLQTAGCDHVIAVLGAWAAAARPLVPAGAEAVEADWNTGMAASLRAGLAAARGDAALVTLVDLPDLPEEAARRVLGDAPARTVLRRATYAGAPGHPVLIGAEHWDAVRTSISGDAGAGPYLASHGAELVECGDLWSGADVDGPPAPVVE